MGARVLSIGTAAPTTELDVESSVRLAESFAPAEDRGRLRSLYRDAGVSRRGSTLAGPDGPDALFRDPGERGPGTAARLERYMEAARRLSCEASGSALARAEIGADAVTHLVTVSCTGAQSPGVDHGLIERLGVPRDVSRTHIGFMGCHGAINALAVANAFVRADPAAVVLVACVEVCSLHCHVGGTWDQQVANAIFADGAGSAVVAASGGGPIIRAFASRVFPGTDSLMTWRVGDHGFEMHLSARVSGVLRRHVGAWTDAWLDSEGLARGDVSAWAVHPGGRDILEGVRRGLGLDADALEVSRRILDAHGNMSSGTVLWVLDEMLRSGTGGLIAGMSFGPGLSGEAVLLDAGSPRPALA